MKKHVFPLVLSALMGLSFAVHAVDSSRQAEVAQRGSEVMPFNLKDTTHFFTKTSSGGTQRVVAKDVSNTEQIQRVRQHLQEIQVQFNKGDFSGPEHIHGMEMPGLAELKGAKPGQIVIGYKEVKGGAELVFRTSDSKLIQALHQWFDAQLADHGADAMEGHVHHHADMPKN